MADQERCSATLQEFLRYAEQPPDEANPAPQHILVPYLTAVFNATFSAGAIPESWQTSLVTPIFKRGDKGDPTSYRPIAVGEPLARLYAAILNSRLVCFTESNSLRSDTQAGFRPKLSTVHQFFALQHVIDKRRHRKQPLYCCFIDLKSAYDKVQRPLLWQVLQRLGLHGSMLAAVQSLYSSCKLAVKIHSRAGSSVSPAVGLRQGCPLSPTLFGLFIDGLHAFLQQQVPGAGVHMPSLLASDLEYADDIMLIATSPQQLQQLIDATHNYCQQMGMQVSSSKTEVMAFTFATSVAVDAAQQWTCDGQPLKKVDSFKYLGLHIHSSGDIQHTISHLQPRAAGAWAVVQKKHKQLGVVDSVNLKLKLHGAIMPPTLCYGSEIWGLYGSRTARTERAKLERCYERQLRQICGVRQSVPAHVVLAELGAQPLHFRWWRQTLHFWSKLREASDRNFHKRVLLDNIHDAVQFGIPNFAHSVLQAVRELGVHVERRWDVVPVLDEQAIMAAVQGAYDKFWRWVPDDPTMCGSQGVKACTYWRWFSRPHGVSFRQSYIHLPINGAAMRRLVRFRVGSHDLPVEKGRRQGILRAQRVCVKCSSAFVCDEHHVVFECTYLQSLRHQYGFLFSKQIQGRLQLFVWQQRQESVARFLLEVLRQFDA